jgi:MFS transporter, NRE family, putaive nickel resistance protein
VQNLIADRVSTEIQGRVYGAHFAWSHLWWVFSYPLAGFLGQYLPRYNFGASSLVGFLLLIIVWLVFQPQKMSTVLQQGQWHQHDHIHDESHTHQHPVEIVSREAHSHLHFHSSTDL